MEIAIIGTGYVGLVAGVCFADVGHRVTCVDKDQSKISLLNDNKIPIYEPGLEDLIATAKNRLTFTTDLKSSVEKNEVIFIAVGTPELPDGNADLGPTMAVVKAICEAANGEKIIVLKSTVPIGTGQKIKDFCKENCQYSLEVVNNPEFLKEGAAIEDFLKPDRVVIGCASAHAANVMGELYEPFVRNGHPILFMDNTSAEMTKYAANSFLSVKISFINELARLADKVGADINQVRKGFTSDSRICPAFFYPGVGYGGSCFPKDVQALVKTGQDQGLDMKVVAAADTVNDEQKLLHLETAEKVFDGNLKGKNFAIWGLAFKPRTDDVREAPALHLIEKLVAAGANVKAFDPAAADTARSASSADFEICDSALEATKDADALFVVTEWNEFKNPNFSSLKEQMKQNYIFDGRNIFDPKKMMNLGFNYFSVGRQKLTDENNL